MRLRHPSLFDGGAPLPPGFIYHPDIVSPAEEEALAHALADLPFSAVVMRGQAARRRTAHFGWTYAYDERRAEPGPTLPACLLELRARAAAWAGVAPEALAEALVTEYPPGAAIGWHRDAPMFGDVVGVSLLEACRMHFRPYVSPGAVTARVGPDDDAVGPPRRVAAPARRTSHVVHLAPRSGYLISGQARRDYEHRIPPVTALRYSITFRTLRSRRPTGPHHADAR